MLGPQHKQTQKINKRKKRESNANNGSAMKR
jgi:hypothetical protein